MPALIASCDIRALAKLVKEASRGRFGREKAEEVKAAAKKSVGITFALDSFSFELKHVIDLIDHIDGQIEALEKTISEALERTSGKWRAAVITAEIGDPDRFEGPKQLIAFAGMDATKAESGKFVGTEEKMSKRGSHHLRFALMTAADKARLHDPCFGDYYDSMIARNKHRYVALSGVARKLAGLILVLMKEQRAYEQRPSVQSEKKL